MKNIKDSNDKSKEDKKYFEDKSLNNEENSKIFHGGNISIKNNFDHSDYPLNIQHKHSNIKETKVKLKLYPPLHQDQKTSFINIFNNNSIYNQMNIINENIYPIGQQIHQKKYELNKTVIMNAFNNKSISLIIQKIIIEAEYETIKQIVNDLKGEYRKIINDKNGNYFAIDLFRNCEVKERIIILEELSPILNEDCNKSYATHPIQTLIDLSSSESEYRLILFSFNDYNKFLFSALDPNGSYTIQKIIKRIPERFRTEFNLIFISFISFISKQKFGIISVKCFITFTKNEDIITQVLNYIKDNFMELAIDRYGNYLIQFLLEKWKDFPEGNEIKGLVVQNFKTMIQYQYSSFVCESFVKMISKKEKIELINNLNLDGIKKTYNPYSTKIIKLLGIDIDINSNNFQTQIQSPLIFNNFIYNNNNLSTNCINPIPYGFSNIRNFRDKNNTSYKNDDNNQDNNKYKHDKNGNI